MVSWRLNEITAEQVGAGTTLEVYIAVPPALEWNGLPANGRRPRGRARRDDPTALEQDGGRGMMKRWQRVSMDASAEDGITIIASRAAARATAWRWQKCSSFLVP
ncbi:hypothetical protein MesoLjLa_64510 (plasmid) [Mesorhizobium sp. L-2-11]|nr:hypothetical protein MesoLjLa_64510 [Mesorhizobium sp. L-2-11]